LLLELLEPLLLEPLLRQLLELLLFSLCGVF
jgi:hypothetical protein